MPFAVKMFPHSEGIKLQAVSKDLVLGTEGLNRKKRYHEGFDAEEGEKKKSKYINKIARRLKKVFNRQWSEEKKLESVWQERKGSLEKKYKLETAVIQSINCSEAVCVGKLKILEGKHKQKLEALNAEMSNRVKDMKARHCAEREAEEKEGVGKMKAWVLVDTEMVPEKSCSLSGNNNLEEENNNELAHNDAAEKSEVAVVPVNGDKSKSPSAAQNNDEAEQSATSKNDILSAESPAMWTASESTTEQHDQASSSSTQHIESTMAQIDTVPVSQEHAISGATLTDVLPSSDQALQNPEPPAPLDTALSRPLELTPPCLVSSGVLLTLPNTPYRHTEAPSQEEHRRPTPNTTTSLPASQQFDPLQKEYERIRGESNQVARNHEEMVSQLISERAKEITELEGCIRRKYEAMVKEAEASFVHKKKELEHSKFKVVMNMRLAQAIRSKYVDLRTALPQQQQQVASHPFRSRLPQSSLQSQSQGPAVEELLMSDGVI